MEKRKETGSLGIKDLVKAAQEVQDRLYAWCDTHRMIWTHTGDESHKNSLENYGRLAYRLKEGLQAFTDTIEKLRSIRDTFARLAVEEKGLRGYGLAQRAVGLAQAIWLIARDTDDYIVYSEIWNITCELGAHVRAAAPELHAPDNQSET
jgi:hypothetical protein